MFVHDFIKSIAAYYPRQLLGDDVFRVFMYKLSNLAIFGRSWPLEIIRKRQYDVIGVQSE